MIRGFLIKRCKLCLLYALSIYETLRRNVASTDSISTLFDWKSCRPCALEFTRYWKVFYVGNLNHGFNPMFLIFTKRSDGEIDGRIVSHWNVPFYGEYSYLNQHRVMVTHVIWGWMNLFARGIGAFALNMKFGMRGRMLRQFWTILLEGMLIKIFRYGSVQWLQMQYLLRRVSDGDCHV